MTNRLNSTNPFPPPRGAATNFENRSSPASAWLPEVNQGVQDVRSMAEAFGDAGLTQGATPFFVANTLRAVPTGPLTDVFIINHGSGYTTAPTLSVVDGGQSARIRFTTRTDNNGFHGEMAEAIIINGGRNYSSNTTVTLPPPDQTVGETNPPTRAIQATVSLTIERGRITAVTFTERGAGYNPGFTGGSTGRFYDAVITDPGTGSGATATCTLDSGIVSGFRIATAQAASQRYTFNPTVTVTGGGGSGCVIEPRIEAGYVTSLRLVNRGTGYTSAPTVTVSGGGITTGHPVITASITTGIIKSVSITNGGTAYNSPRIVINAPANHQAANRGVLLAVAITRGDVPTNQLRIGSTGDDNVLLSRFAPTRTQDPELYTLSIGSAKVKRFLNIDLDYGVANIYFYDLIQRTNQFTVSHNITGRTNDDGTAEVVSSVQGYVPTNEVSLAEVVEEKVIENEAPGLDVDALSERIESVRQTIQTVAISTVDVPAVEVPTTPDPSTPDPGTPDPGTPDPTEPTVPTPEPEMPDFISADIEQVQSNSLVEAFGNEVASEIVTEQINQGISETIGEEYTSGQQVDFDEISVSVDTPPESPPILDRFGNEIEIGRGRTSQAGSAAAGGALVAGAGAAVVAGSATTIVGGGAVTVGVATGGFAAAGYTTSIAVGAGVVATAPVSVPIIIGATVIGGAAAVGAYFFFRDDGTTEVQTAESRGSNDPLSNSFDALNKSPPGPRPGSELPSRGGEDGPSGQGAPQPQFSGPRGSGVSGAQGRVVNVQVTIPTSIVIKPPRNMQPGQSIEVYFRHFEDNVPVGQSPTFIFSRGFNLSQVANPRSTESAMDATPDGLLESVTTATTGSNSVYQVSNEIVGIKITKLSDNEHTVETMGIWPNKQTI